MELANNHSPVREVILMARFILKELFAVISFRPFYAGVLFLHGLIKIYLPQKEL